MGHDKRGGAADQDARRAWGDVSGDLCDTSRNTDLASPDLGQFFRVGEKGKGGGARSARGRGAPEGAAGGGAGGAAMRRRRIGTYRYDWERFHHTHFTFAACSTDLPEHGACMCSTQ